MAFKLTKKQTNELTKLVEKYEHAKSDLSDALDQLAFDWESEFSDKSERWQESEVGQAAQDKIDMVRGWFDDMPADGEPNIDADALT